VKILKIEWRNFSSYGNRLQTLEFPNEACLFQIVGENGAGKTTISQVIAFALYGKVEGKKLGDIPNRINGHAWVRIEFENNGKIITVERGLEPSIFTLSINGIPYDQAGNVNVQTYLADDLIGIPYYVFNNTISLSINDFKSFVKMSPQDKRAIIDKIFGFNILNQMRELLKGEIRKIKESLDTLSGSLSATESTINKSTEEMENLLGQMDEDIKNQTSELNKSLESFQKLQVLHSGKIDAFKEEETKLADLIYTSTKELLEIKGKVESLGKGLKLYESDMCPTCESSLTGEFHEHKKSIMETDLDLSKDKLDEAELVIIKLREKESEMKKTKIDLQDKNNKISQRIRDILRDIELLDDKKNDVQVRSLEKIIKNLETERDKIKGDVFKSAEKNAWVKTLDDILSEKGVKQMAIKTILPSLNSEIMDLLEALHLDYQVVFDDEFKASIYQMGIEIPVQTLSTGEMKKVDFVVLIAIMKLMKLKFSSINLLFLDELFSSVDPDGVTSILRVLQKNSREMGLNIFVINHAPMPHEIFDWKIDIKKTNSFSSMTIDQF
jgi:DNA repair exonuclease SbcCD ATPase subunit